MKIRTTFRATVLAVAIGVAGMSVVSAQEGMCLEGTAANSFPAWEFIANNAVRTADAYAVERNPRATFILGKVSALLQFGGEYKGQYLVHVVKEGASGTAFAVLKPNFPFCEDPGELDDERADLFTVISAKFNGQPF
ncbi:hypothetical protein [Telmatospirillum sp. J64-1]|uniref:hypothetical protein n=1 Tax=Telmatospirillum sp. J64-1 TaxID=2502183 RepID=UPI00115E8E98|nr:hypothetical protein [Telmatospirillum sp. J64-1]